MTITIIAAMDKNRAIGKDGKLPWHIPSDLRHFKYYTLNKPVYMGYKTFESLNFYPLKNRRNYVKVTKEDNIIRTKDGYVVGLGKHSMSLKGNEIHIERQSIGDFLQDKKDYLAGKELCVIGGASIYEQALPFADRMILSVIDIEIEGGGQVLSAIQQM